MNILHLADIHTVTSNYTTGIAEVVLTLSATQRQLGHNSKLGIITRNYYLERMEGIEYYDYNKFENDLKNNRYDIVIFHSLYKYPYLRFSRLLKKQRVPYCIEFHGASTVQNASKGKLKKRIANFFGFNRFIKNAASLIYLSQKEKDLCVFKELNEKSIIIPNGVNPRTNVLQRKNPPTRNRKIEFLFLARIDVYHKGLDLLCDALDILVSDGYDKYIHFSFYGVEKFGHYFNDRIKSLSVIAEYKGPRVGESKFEEFEKGDIYILTSRYEGMPVTVLEALSCGCPCVITPQTNMTDLILNNNCGWVTSLQPKVIAETIKTASVQYRKEYTEYWLNSIDASKLYEWQRIVADSIDKYMHITSRYNR